MRFARLKEISRTLRFRLTMWNTAVVLVMILFTLWGVRESLRLVLWHEADSQLAEDAREVELIIRQFHPNFDSILNELDRKAITHTHRGFFVRLYDVNARRQWSSGNSPVRSMEDALSRPLAEQAISDFDAPVTLEEHRVIHARVQVGKGEYLVRVGILISPLEADIQKISLLMMYVGGIALLISPVGGFWLAGRATQPIAQIIETTNRLQPDRLDERLHVGPTGDEIDRLSTTINGFLDRIAAFVKQNREFTAIAAHELRSPLAAIQSSLEIAANADRSVEEYKELLADVLAECEQLRKLVNQLLLLAESDRSRLTVATIPVDFRHVVDRAVEMFRGVAETSGITLNLIRNDPAFVTWEVSRLRQIINNLIDNALKFTPAGGTVTVELFAPPKSKEVRLTVTDTGIGIGPEDLPHVFERFFRAEKSRDRDQGPRGTGLGLPICRSIVEAKRGKIDIESALGKGTSVVVTLPRSQVDPDEAALLEARNPRRANGHS